VTRELGWWLRIVLAGVRVQVSRGRGGTFILGAVAVPVLYALVFVLMAKNLGRANELAPFLVLGPALIGVWYSAIITGGAVIADERGSGTLELLVAAPAPTGLVVLGRVTGNTLMSLIGIPLVLITARLLGAELAVIDLFRAALGLLALAISTVAMTLIFSSTFVLARSAVVLANLIPHPLYILSGIAFPVALLPAWAQALSSILALSWIAELLRSSTRPDSSVSILPILGAVAALTVAYAASGYWLFARVERAIRANGKVSLLQ